MQSRCVERGPHGHRLAARSMLQEDILTFASQNPRSKNVLEEAALSNTSLSVLYAFLVAAWVQENRRLRLYDMGVCQEYRRPLWLNMRSISRRESYGRPKSLGDALNARGHGFRFASSVAVDECTVMRPSFSPEKCFLFCFFRG